MRRREFITLLDGAAPSSPLAARAQQQPFPVVGSLDSASAAGLAARMAALRQGLRDSAMSPVAT
jgi:hypothetical protein